MKNLFRIISVVLAVLFFIPSFLVSCSGQEVGSFSAANATLGISVDMYGTGQKTKVSDPQMWLILLIIIPIIILIIWLVNMDAKLQSGITIAAAVIDLVIWNYAKTNAENLANRNNCQMEPQAGYFLSIIMLIVMIVAAGLVLLNVLQVDGFKSGRVSQDSNSFSRSSAPPSSRIVNGMDDAINSDQFKFCTKCGVRMDAYAAFCPKCGNKMP